MPATGTTSRPGEASCASSSSGSSPGLGGDQHPVVRRAGRHAEHAGLGRPDPRPRQAGAGEVGGAEPDQVRLELDAHHPPLRAGQVREQRGGPPGAAAHVEHPVAGPHLRAAAASSATVRGWLQVWPCPRSSGPSYDARRTWCGGRNPARGTDSNASLTASTPPVNRASAAAGRTSTCGRRTRGSPGAASSSAPAAARRSRRAGSRSSPAARPRSAARAASRTRGRRPARCPTRRRRRRSSWGAGSSPTGRGP